MVTEWIKFQWTVQINHFPIQVSLKNYEENLTNPPISINQFECINTRPTHPINLLFYFLFLQIISISTELDELDWMIYNYRLVDQ